MATTWSPRTNFEKKSWLLKNGEVVTEPPLEESSSGLKVRIAGTSVSAYTRDIDTLLFQGAKQIAHEKQTEVWMPLHGGVAAEQQALGIDTAKVRAGLHFVDTTLHSTVAWWRFKHPTMPIEAVLKVEAAPIGYHYRNSTTHQADHNVSVVLVMPGTAPTGGCLAIRLVEDCPTWEAHLGMAPSSRYEEVREFFRDNKQEWAEMMGSWRSASPRQVVSMTLNKVREGEKLDRITVPDLRDPENPAWLELELFDSNVNQKFIADMVDYLDGSPSVEAASRLYDELLNAFRAIGMVLPPKSDNDFLAALSTGSKEALSIRLGSPDDVGHAKDHNHALVLDLRTGTMIVECSLAGGARDESATKWDEQLMLAQMTGKEQEFLNHHRRYQEEGASARRKRIIRERSFNPDQ